ncbi:hypothetical protein J4G08_00280 [Candidatus Poribacteria bacterium]|nr:hypothetical protein [Candidatus Poribacteria bacterium]
MKVQVFKSIALLLCILILFTTVIPQAQAGWGFWKCLALGAAVNSAFIAALLICVAPDATIIGCVAAWAAFFALRSLKKKKCK